MKQIADPDGNPRVFFVEHDVGGVWLGNRWTDPGDAWGSDREFVFRLRK